MSTAQQGDLGVCLHAKADARVVMDGVVHTGSERVELWFHPAEPLQVDLVLQNVTWVFARELLLVGLQASTGIGDVRVWPGPDLHTVTVHMQSPEGQITLLLPRREVRLWLTRTLDLVPAGCGYSEAALDATAARLLDGGAG